VNSFATVTMRRRRTRSARIHALTPPSGQPFKAFPA
jgi:hypothetical protein